MLLCRFVYICTHLIAFCFTFRHLSVFSPNPIRICTAQYFFLCLRTPAGGQYIYHAHFSFPYIIN